ncbi:MAG: response regulator [Gammaproteobacteria bacterium]|nr:response regulator [Gammaproteobacteria bacterium]MDH3405586.1 response regulator [Gammaproteobacteria bacterium]MDH3563023.1 response regulator [Gammaproteobacteria bacterium]MDH5486585.1 response regulator [Gammaproteobacteria bacterium]
MNKVLLVDDDHELVDFLSAALSEKGWQVQTAYNAEEAYHSSQHNRPDVIVLDIHMPAGGGKTALERMRTSHVSYDIPVLLMSADVDTAMSPELRKLHPNGFIRKPLETERLHLALMRLIEGKLA